MKILNKISEEVHTFWFGDLDNSSVLDKEREITSRWFNVNKDFDAEVRDRFFNYYELLKAEETISYSNPLEALCAILIFDQFPRNMFRGNPAMFETDDKAVNLAKKLIREQGDKSLSFIERVFVYMPLMHSEILQDQKLMLKKFEELCFDVERNNVVNSPYYRNITDIYAPRHKEIIERFKRFPHRNKVLGRKSTDAELSFLTEDLSSF